MENPGMLRFVPDHLKIKRVCKCGAKKLLLVIRYVSGRYNTSGNMW